MAQRGVVSVLVLLLLVLSAGNAVGIRIVNNKEDSQQKGARMQDLLPVKRSVPSGPNQVEPPSNHGQITSEKTLHEPPPPHRREG